MATHSSTLPWKIPWTEEPGRLQSMGLVRVGHDWATSLSLFLSCIGEGNGNSLQCSCLESPRDGGSWWAAVYGVAQSWTWLKWLSSSSSTIENWTWCVHFLGGVDYMSVWDHKCQWYVIVEPFTWGRLKGGYFRKGFHDRMPVDTVGHLIKKRLLKWRNY